MMSVLKVIVLTVLTVVFFPLSLAAWLVYWVMRDNEKPKG